MKVFSNVVSFTHFALIHDIDKMCQAHHIRKHFHVDLSHISNLQLKPSPLQAIELWCFRV